MLVRKCDRGFSRRSFLGARFPISLCRPAPAILLLPEKIIENATNFRLHSRYLSHRNLQILLVPLKILLVLLERLDEKP